VVRDRRGRGDYGPALDLRRGFQNAYSRSYAVAYVMTARKLSPATVAAEIRRLLRDGGSAEHAAGVQWFFKDEIESHGWYTAKLRTEAILFRRRIRKEFGLDFLVQVADRLFDGLVLEERFSPCFLLQKLTEEFGEAEFRLFEAWLTPDHELGRSRCPGAQSNCPDGGCQARTNC